MTMAETRNRTAGPFQNETPRQSACGLIWLRLNKRELPYGWAVKADESGVVNLRDRAEIGMVESYTIPPISQKLLDDGYTDSDRTRWILELVAAQKWRQRHEGKGLQGDLTLTGMRIGKILDLYDFSTFI